MAKTPPVPPEQTSGRAGLGWRAATQSSEAGAGAAQVPLRAATEPAPDLRPGYTTVDDLGDDGDDTLHSPIAFYDVPNCIQAPVGFRMEDDGERPDTVDLVYNEFIQPWVVLALKYLGEKVEEGDSAVYLAGKSFTEVIREWVEEYWQVATEKCPQVG